MLSNLPGLPPGASESVCRIINAALQAADPAQAVLSSLAFDGRWLRAGAQTFDLNACRRVIGIGFGKASPTMGRALLSLLKDRVESITVVGKPIADTEAEPIRKDQLTILWGSHPVPGPASIEATRQMLASLGDLSADDLVICLVSGGASALLTEPAAGLTLGDLQALTRQLLACGANIKEINTLRKHLDTVKGGQLAARTYPARLLTLILSDVVGSPLDIIASGPTVPDASTRADALALLDKYQLRPNLPPAVLRALNNNPETPKPGDPRLALTQNLLVGSNEGAARAAVEAARAAGFHSAVLTTRLTGEAAQAGLFLAGVLSQMARHNEPLPRSACLVAGGETTVTLRGSGVGGRNLELALAALPELAGLENAALITLATDGDDGNSGVAGAVACAASLERARALGLDPAAYLARNDSFPFWQQTGSLLPLAQTGTNVNDLAFLVTW